MFRRLQGILLLVGLLWDLGECGSAGHTRRRAMDCLDDTAGGIVLPPQIPGHIVNLGQLVPITTKLWPKHSDNPGFETFKVFKDIDDVAIVAKRGAACYAVFRSTSLNPLDIWQLYNFRKKDFGTCTVRKGFYNAYFSSYYDVFVNEVNQCMSRGNNELVLGGHSQGGSIAVVASIDFKHYNPTVITVGGVRTLKKQCSDVDPSRHYRFVNALSNEYDDWPMSFNKQATHVGHAFLLDPQASPPAAYVGFNDNKNRSTSSRDHHKYQPSFEAFSNLFAFNCPSVRIAGWDNGHHCSGDEECLGSCVGSVCRSYQPFTSTPVTPPTPWPTTAPVTQPPTPRPTPAPVTSQPTSAPTLAPVTNAPTPSPTHAPITSQPTFKPTHSPTSNPPTSLMPSLSPSQAPVISKSPTQTPSFQPSESATPSDSLRPSQNPSEAPSISIAPSQIPSAMSSEQLSSRPSTSPSASPTSRPTTSPSEPPSQGPTTRPSLRSSREPSTSPSLNPSTAPSSIPSKSPSVAPSLSPSEQPSSSPSISPSETPSSMPSANPSFSRSMPPLSISIFGGDWGLLEP